MLLLFSDLHVVSLNITKCQVVEEVLKAFALVKAAIAQGRNSNFYWKSTKVLASTHKRPIPE